MEGPRLVVLGVPMPQGSKRAMIHRTTGKVVMFDADSKALRAWRKEITVAARAWMKEQRANPMTGPVKVGIDFRLPRPKSHDARSWPVGHGSKDLDKLLRAALDAMTKVVYVDDAQVVAIRTSKDYGVPGVTIAVDSIEGTS